MTASDTAPAPSLYRFGDCELDLLRHELRRGGERIEVQPRVFDCLAYLVVNHSRSIGKQELQDAIWGRQVVTEAALTRSIMKARRAIGDDAETPRWIRTVHARGYQFIGAVETSAAVGLQTLPEIPAPESVRDDNADTGPSRRLLFPALASLLLLATLTAAAYWLLRDDTRQPSTVAGLRLAVLPVINASGDPLLDWVELGLMTQIERHLEHGLGLPVVGARRVLETLGEHVGEAGADQRARLFADSGASHLVAARIERQAARLHLRYEVQGSDGNLRRRTLVGETPNELVRGLVHDLDALFGRRGRRPPISDDILVNEAYLRGLSMQLAGRAREAEALFAVAIESAPDSYWPRYEHALSLRALRRYDEALAALESLKTHPTTTEALARTSLYNSLGVTLLRMGRYAEAEQVLLTALASIGQRADAESESVAMTNLGIVTRHLGRLDEADDWLQQAAARSLAAGRQRVPGWILNSHAQVALARADDATAERLLLAAIEGHRLTGSQGSEASSLSLLGGLRAKQQRWAEAAALHHDAYSLREKLEDEAGQAWSLVQLAEARHALGDDAAAQDGARRALTLATGVGDDGVAQRAQALLDASAIAAAEPAAVPPRVVDGR